MTHVELDVLGIASIVVLWRQEAIATQLRGQVVPEHNNLLGPVSQPGGRGEEEGGGVGEVVGIK